MVSTLPRSGGRSASIFARVVGLGLGLGLGLVAGCRGLGPGGRMALPQILNRGTFLGTAVTAQFPTVTNAAIGQGGDTD
ncbi:hypothetical protein [Arthrobacter sp. TB 23]|uniref:hypothetical protein n=1 Tax=Arthrobacter sp. TB 23 TaxID=494419 RepID=UPI0002ECDA6C|nr:hypothetical protein [Arthrobacter sp. TB 23]